jgi:hypothetical protein
LEPLITREPSFGFALAAPTVMPEEVSALPLVHANEPGVLGVKDRIETVDTFPACSAILSWPLFVFMGPAAPPEAGQSVHPCNGSDPLQVLKIA